MCSHLEADRQPCIQPATCGLHNLQMLLKTAAMLVCFAAMVTFELACCCSVFLGQRCSIASPALGLRLVDDWERRQTRAVRKNAGVATRTVWHRRLLRQAAGNGRLFRLVEHVERRFRVAAVDRHRTIGFVLADSAGAGQRGGMGATVRLACWETGWRGADRESMLSAWTRHLLFRGRLEMHL